MKTIALKAEEETSFAIKTKTKKKKTFLRWYFLLRLLMDLTLIFFLQDACSKYVRKIWVYFTLTMLHPIYLVYCSVVTKRLFMFSCILFTCLHAYTRRTRPSLSLLSRVIDKNLILNEIHTTYIQFGSMSTPFTFASHTYSYVMCTKIVGSFLALFSNSPLEKHILE